MTTSLRPNKRYIATHDAKGKSVYADSPDQKYRSAGDPPANFLARSYAVSSVPVVMKDDADMKAYLAEDGPTSYTKPDIVIPGGGVNIVTVDMAPGGESAMHHTVSLDYSICVIGTIDHELDGGEKVRLYPGDHIIQRGTTHKWINASKTEPARFLGITLAAEPFDIPGKGLLAEKFYGPEDQDPSKL